MKQKLMALWLVNVGRSVDRLHDDQRQRGLQQRRIGLLVGKQSIVGSERRHLPQRRWV